jgi:hypothetical protein
LNHAPIAPFRREPLPDLEEQCSVLWCASDVAPERIGSGGMNYIQRICAGAVGQNAEAITKAAKAVGVVGAPVIAVKIVGVVEAPVIAVKAIGAKAPIVTVEVISAKAPVIAIEPVRPDELPIGAEKLLIGRRKEVRALLWDKSVRDDHGLAGAWVNGHDRLTRSERRGWRLLRRGDGLNGSHWLRHWPNGPWYRRGGLTVLRARTKDCGQACQ